MSDTAWSAFLITIAVVAIFGLVLMGHSLNLDADLRKENARQKRNIGSLSEQINVLLREVKTLKSDMSRENDLLRSAIKLNKQRSTLSSYYPYRNTIQSSSVNKPKR